MVFVAAAGAAAAADAAAAAAAVLDERREHRPERDHKLTFYSALFIHYLNYVMNETIEPSNDYKEVIFSILYDHYVKKFYENIIKLPFDPVIKLLKELNDDAETVNRDEIEPSVIGFDIFQL